MGEDIESEITAERAAEIDRTLIDITRREESMVAVAARLMYEMGEGAFRHLGYDTYTEYLDSRSIKRSRGHLLRGAYKRITIELGVPESEWNTIPIGRIQGCLTALSPTNVHEILDWARVTPQGEIQERLRQKRGEGRPKMPGVYLLTLCPQDDLPTQEAGSRRAVRGSLFEDANGDHYLQIR